MSMELYKTNIDNGEILDCLVFEEEYSLQNNYFTKEKIKFLINKLGKDTCDLILSYSAERYLKLFNLVYNIPFKNTNDLVYFAKQELGDLYDKTLINNMMKKIQKILEINYLRNFEPDYEYNDLFININFDSYEIELKNKIIFKNKACRKYAYYNAEIKNFLNTLEFYKPINGNHTIDSIYLSCVNYIPNPKPLSESAVNRVNYFINEVIHIYENNEIPRKEKFKRITNIWSRRRKLLTLYKIDNASEERERIKYFEKCKQSLNILYGIEKYK